MRRSRTVQLTLLPMLAAAAAVAHADPPTVPENLLPPDAPMLGFAPPGMTEQVLMPPGMTPPVDCDDDDGAWNTRPECQPATGYYLWDGRVIRGGFGRYFWTAGG